MDSILMFWSIECRYVTFDLVTRKKCDYLCVCVFILSNVSVACCVRMCSILICS